MLSGNRTRCLDPLLHCTCARPAVTGSHAYILSQNTKHAHLLFKCRQGCVCFGLFMRIHSGDCIKDVTLQNTDALPAGGNRLMRLVRACLLSSSGWRGCLDLP
jgi:hypothetical protein